MFRDILRETGKMRARQVRAVEEGHDAVRSDVQLVTGVLSEDGEGGDVQADLAGLSELAYMREIWVS
jgi:hypothetical protein